MTRQEAIWYLEPIANSASLERYKEALTLEMQDDPYGHFGLHLLGWRAYRQKPEEAIP